MNDYRLPYSVVSLPDLQSGNLFRIFGPIPKGTYLRALDVYIAPDHASVEEGATMELYILPVLARDVGQARGGRSLLQTGIYGDSFNIPLGSASTIQHFRVPLAFYANIDDRYIAVIISSTASADALVALDTNPPGI